MATGYMHAMKDGTQTSFRAVAGQFWALRNRPGPVEFSYSPIDGAGIKRILIIMNTNTKSVTETQAFEALRLAQCHEHLGALASSAKLCAVDAEALFNRGDFTGCARRARESLRYSVGVFHTAYAKVAA